MDTATTTKCPECSGTGLVPNYGYLRALRLERGARLREVAERVGLSIPYINDIELGRRRLSGPLAQRIEEAIRGVPIK